MPRRARSAAYPAPLASAGFVLIGAAEEPDEELGIDLHPQCHDERCADVLRDLQLSKSEHPIEPLTRGDWK